MNSLSELNSYASTNFTYTDLRDPGVIFDRPLGWDQTVSINQSQTHTIPVGLNIIEVVRPDDSLPSFTVDVSACPGATVSWASLPNGSVLQNPQSGIYTVNNITTVSAWNTVKSPTITVPTNYTGSFTYTATVYWNNKSDFKGWNIRTTVADISYLNTAIDQIYFNKSEYQQITNPPLIVDFSLVTWRMVITPSQSTYIQLLSTSGSGGTVTFDSVNKILTLQGTKDQINSHLNTLYYTTTATAKYDFSLQYTLTNLTLGDADTRTQQFNTLEYISKTRGNETYSLNTSTTISNGPLITDPDYDGSGTYTMTVEANDSNAVQTLSSTGRYQWTTTNLTVNGTSTSKISTNDVVLSRDNSLMIVSSKYSDNQGLSLWKGLVYTRSGNTWVKKQDLILTGYDNTGYLAKQVTMSYFPYIRNIKISADNSTIVIGIPGEDPNPNGSYNPLGAVYVYSLVSGTYTQTARITPPASLVKNSVFGEGVAVNSNGTVIFVDTVWCTNSVGVGTQTIYPYRKKIYIYTKSGGSWGTPAEITNIYNDAFSNARSDSYTDSFDFAYDTTQFFYTDLFDVIPMPSNFTLSGTATLSSTQKKFGSTSLYLPNAGGAGSASAYLSASAPTYGNYNDIAEAGWTGGYTYYVDGNGVQQINYGQGDYTVECFVYMTNNSGVRQTIFGQNSNAYGYEINLYIEGNVVKFNYGNSDGTNSSTPLITGGTSLSINTWYHIALCRTSGVTKLFLNGTQQGSNYSDTMSLSNSRSIKQIGAARGVYGFCGYIDEFRWSMTSKYSSSFTAPTSIFASENTNNLLCHFEGTDGATTTAIEQLRAPGIVKNYIWNGASWILNQTITPFADIGNATLGYNIRHKSNTVLWLDYFDYIRGQTSSYVTRQYKYTYGGSRTAKTITVNDNAKISTTQSKFGGSSLYFDGTNDYINIASNSDFAFGTGDFCLEAQVYTTTNGGIYQPIYEMRTTATEAALFVGILTTNVIYIYLNGAIVIQSTTALAINTWYHIALSRSGTSLRLFINGVQEGSTFTDNNNYASKPVRIGNTYTSANGFTGYIDELRISKGVSRYTSTFTPPTAAFSNDSNTVLLIHADGANNSTTIVEDVGGIWTNTSTYIDGGFKDITTDENYFTREVEPGFKGSVYRKYGSNYVLEWTSTVRNSSSIVLSDDAQMVITTDTDVNPYGAFYNNTRSTTGTSFNNTTKVLTLSGTRDQVNRDIDTIQYTPQTGYASNFQFIYTVTTPRNDIDSREQTVTKV